MFLASSAVANAPLLKRLTVWLLERLIEVCLLGGLFAYLVSLSAKDPTLTLRNAFSAFWVYGSVVAVVLFLNGYYVTTALFGVIWRGTRAWIYPAITLFLFVLHTHIIFMYAGPDITPEVRAMQLPFAFGGSGIVSLCAFAGSRVLAKWTSVPFEPNAYLNALGVIVLLFGLSNAAHFLRPVVGNTAFRAYGLPFAFYREGGFVREWVWKPGEFLWIGIAADLAIVAVSILLLGRMLFAVRSEH
ncbi:MAG: hypothetical protein ABL995_17740 [Bryobacteraceae bacterium]